MYIQAVEVNGTYHRPQLQAEEGGGGVTKEVMHIGLREGGFSSEPQTVKDRWSRSYQKIGRRRIGCQ